MPMQVVSTLLLKPDFICRPNFYAEAGNINIAAKNLIFLKVATLSIFKRCFKKNLFQPTQAFWLSNIVADLLLFVHYFSYS